VWVQLAALGAEQLAALSVEQLNALSQEQLGAFNAGQLTRMPAATLQALQAFAEKRMAEAKARGEKVDDVSAPSRSGHSVSPSCCPVVSRSHQECRHRAAARRNPARLSAHQHAWATDALRGVLLLGSIRFAAACRRRAAT
jgi:hypothetical protein